METTTTNTPAAWVGCLSCYNNGLLNGKWITAEQAANDNPVTYCGLAEIVTIGDYTAPKCVKCGGDEFDVMDSEHLPSSLQNTRTFYENAEQLAELDNNNELDRLLILASWLMIEDLNDLITYDHDYYEGQFERFQDYAEQLLDDTGDLETIPEHLRPYFDYSAYADDLQHDYYHDSATGHTWRSA